MDGSLENGADREEDESVVTMTEVIEGLEAQELEADLVLGGDDGKDCTFPKGYLPRQAVFSCVTCCPEGNAGVCTACSMTCHDGHEVVELWTRRHFRCDCGNSKFGVGVCRLFSSKDPENFENVYNQNYQGAYCTCKRPYPDPVGEDQGEMLQCCICEDWFHETHLGLAPSEEVPRDEDGEPLYDELICQACAVSLDFLSCYSNLLVPVGGPGINPNKDTSIQKDNAVMQGPVHTVGQVDGPPFTGISTFPATPKSGGVNLYAGLSAQPVVVDVSQSHHADVTSPVPFVSTSSVVLGPEMELETYGKNSDNGKVLGSKRELVETNGISSNNKFASGRSDSRSQSQSGITSCKLTVLRNSGKPQKGEVGKGNVTDEVAVPKVLCDKALFLVKNWRAQLCRCDACCNLYSVKGVSFLLDSEDTLSQYEEAAKQKRKEKLDAEPARDLAFLNSLGHVGQIEFLHKLNDMTSEFSTHFASFGESGRTITSDDIHEFFDNLKRKRMRFS